MAAPGTLTPQSFKADADRQLSSLPDPQQEPTSLNSSAGCPACKLWLSLGFVDKGYPQFD